MVSGNLSDEEKAMVAARYELVMEVLAKRHGITERDIVESVQWVKRHRDWVEAMKRSSTIAVIGLLFSAMLLALWEAVKHMVNSK